MSARIVIVILTLLASTPSAAQELKVAMGSTLPPMHFIDASGRLAGFEVDLVDLYAREHGLKVTYVDPSKFRKSSMELVAAGMADIAVNAITITDERKRTVLFTDPYFTSYTGMLTRTEFADTIDFFKADLVTVRGSLYAQRLRYLNAPNIKEVSTVTEALHLLDDTARARPAILIYDILTLRKATADDHDLRVLDMQIGWEKYGIAAKNPSFIAAWNDFLAKANSDGRYRNLYNKWFSRGNLPASPAAPMLSEDCTGSIDGYMIVRITTPAGKILTIDPSKSRNDTDELGMANGIFLLPAGPNEPKKILVNNSLGALVDIETKGDHGISVVSIEHGTIASFGTPTTMEFSGLSPDGKFIFLTSGGLKFDLGTASGRITNITILGKRKRGETPEYLHAKAAGLDVAVSGKTNRNEEYAITCNQAPAQIRSCSIHIFAQNTGKFVKRSAFLPGAFSYRSQYVMDDKLFLSDFGDIPYNPTNFNIVDINTGLKLGTGPSGQIVPVGPHELFHCGENQIIDTRTLERRKLNIDLPCPGKTGEIHRHTIPGYYIYLSFTLC